MTSTEKAPEATPAGGSVSEEINHTVTLFIDKHSAFSREIRILDLTAVSKKPRTELNDEYKKEIKALAEAETGPPTFTLHANNIFKSKWTMKDTSNTILANWKHPVFSSGTAHLSFPTSSDLSSHEISTKPISIWRRTETFVKDSETYTWEMESKVMSRRFKLYKGIAPNRKVVASYAEIYYMKSGGVVAVDGTELDPAVVALLTCVVLKRNRQRSAERNSNGGGGGGGGG